VQQQNSGAVEDFI